jgi:hypothetical protein
MTCTGRRDQQSVRRASVRRAVRPVRVVPLAAVVLAGCASAPRSALDEPLIDPSAVTVEVQNHNFNDATVYAVGAGVRMRVGRVTGKSDETFTFRWHQEMIRMAADFTGGGEVLSGQHTVVPGASQDLVLIISVSPNVTATLLGR